MYKRKTEYIILCFTKILKRTHYYFVIILSVHQKAKENHLYLEFVDKSKKLLIS